MFFKRNKVEVVPAMNDVEYEEEKAKYKYASRKEVMGSAVLSTAIGVGAVGWLHVAAPVANEIATSTVISEPVNVMASAAESSQVVEAYTPLAVNASGGDLTAVPTGFIADKSLEMLTTVLDPVIQILVAISFPIASVIMVGACFFFMLGNSERAWNMIMNAGLGYVLIQLSPLFLEILRQVGDAVA